MDMINMIQPVPINNDAGVRLSVLRLDRIHPEISGNKIFKLYYFLQEALLQKKPLVTFGGAWSNHLYATAAACSELGIPCTGIVRGQEPSRWSDTLIYCKEKGMRLEFVSRKEYNCKHLVSYHQVLLQKFGEHILVPEGGYSEAGMKGAERINEYIPDDTTCICCAAGTGTTMAGVMKKGIEVLGISVIDQPDDLEERISTLMPSKKNFRIIRDYTFDGYAKKSDTLIAFMNMFYNQYNIPTDFVYTAKLMFGITDMINKKYFPGGSHIVCIHSGGLQGNRSLQAGVLNF